MLDLPNFTNITDAIKQFIDSNLVAPTDIPNIVQMHFPSDEEVKQIAEYLYEHKLIFSLDINRTKEIIQSTLEYIAQRYLTNFEDADTEETTIMCSESDLDISDLFMDGYVSYLFNEE